MTAKLKDEDFLDAKFQELSGYVVYSKALANDGFKFALATWKRTTTS